MQAMESQFDVCTEDLFNQTVKLEGLFHVGCLPPFIFVNVCLCANESLLNNHDLCQLFQ